MKDSIIFIKLVYKYNLFFIKYKLSFLYLSILLFILISFARILIYLILK